MWQAPPPRPPPVDADYYDRRAVEEEKAARHAGSKVARERHEELAMMYRFRASAARGEWPPPDDSPAETEDAHAEQKAGTSIWL